MTPRTRAGLRPFRPVRPGSRVALVAPASPFVREELDAGVAELDAHVNELLQDETRDHAHRIMLELTEMGAPERIARMVARLFEMDGAIGLAGSGKENGSTV